jgi:hypothetical protein
MSTYYEARYLPATESRGSRIKIVGASSGKHVATMPFRHERGGGQEQFVYAVIDATGVEVARALYETKRGYIVVTGEDETGPEFKLEDVVTCNCGAPMIPNVSTGDEDGYGWSCTNLSCGDWTGGEIEADDLIVCGCPEWLAVRIAALADAVQELEVRK